jgi:predicted metalloprotease with PDZ domain
VPTNARLLIAALLAAAAPSIAQSPPIRITADLSEAARHLYHAEIDIPAKPGPLTLITPEWIPGEHRPDGPVEEFAGIVFTANGKTLPWHRDDVHLFEYHVDVPTGVSSIHAHLDAIVPARVTPHMAVLEWERLLLYPANTPVRDIPIQPSVIVPAGWAIGTALTPEASGLTPSAPTGIAEEAHAPPPGAQLTRYAPTNVEQLEDSPILTGQYLHEFPLASEITPKHFIDVASDEPRDSDLRPELLAELANLVREAGAAYGPPHFNAYHFLLTLSDTAGGEGLEHGQSSDNGIDEGTFRDADHQLAQADLLPHEFTHSWNGKYRRPAGLYQPDFATPQRGDLLWVYEGLTQYMGYVLASRSGLITPAQYRDIMASAAARLDAQAGRAWRSTEDTAVSSSILRVNGAAWANWRRSQDYYWEGDLVWLDADTLIRQLTSNKNSLTDFFHIFLARGGAPGPLILPYDIDEIVTDLNQVAPYDWAKFFAERIDTIQPRADTAGIERAGYRLDYSDKPTRTETTLNTARRGAPAIDVWYSIGIRVTSDGTLTDIRWDGPADKAKLSPGQKIYAVNGTVFSAEALHSAIRDAKGKPDPIHLILQTGNQVSSVDLDYHLGERYPILTRIDNIPDLLTDITKPLTTAPTAPSAK